MVSPLGLTPPAITSTAGTAAGTAGSSNAGTAGNAGSVQKAGQAGSTTANSPVAVEQLMKTLLQLILQLLLSVINGKNQPLPAPTTPLPAPYSPTPSAPLSPYTSLGSSPVSTVPNFLGQNTGTANPLGYSGVGTPNSVSTVYAPVSPVGSLQSLSPLSTPVMAPISYPTGSLPTTGLPLGYGQVSPLNYQQGGYSPTSRPISLGYPQGQQGFGLGYPQGTYSPIGSPIALGYPQAQQLQPSLIPVPVPFAVPYPVSTGSSSPLTGYTATPIPVVPQAPVTQSPLLFNNSFNTYNNSFNNYNVNVNGSPLAPFTPPPVVQYRPSFTLTPPVSYDVPLPPVPNYRSGQNGVSQFF